jgi:hypothetical protein
MNNTHSLGYIIGYVGAGAVFCTLFFGTIYFFIRGLKVPYFKAITNPWILIASLILSISLYIDDIKTPSSVKNTNVNTATESRSYTSSESNEFMSDCTDRTKLSFNIDDRSVQKMCACELAEFQKIYTFDDLKSILKKTSDDKMATYYLNDISRRCTKK